MARIRSVHPGLASDEAYMSMTMAAKAAWPLLWTECDDKGVFEWKPVVLKARIFPADNVDFASVLAEYEALGCVRMFTVNGKSYGAVRNFGKYQRPKKPNSVYPITDELRTYAALQKAGSEPMGNQFGTNGEKSQQMEDGGCSKEEIVMSETSSDAPQPEKKKRVKNDYPQDFQTFYAAYPADPGMSKPEALKEWLKLLDDDRDKALKAIPAFKAWVAKQGRDYRILHACRYLSQRRFEGFDLAESQQSSITQFLAKPGMREWEAWQSFEKTPISEKTGGWYFPTQWPPNHEPRAA